MKPRLSVIEVLQETFLLAGRYWKLVLGLTIFAVLPRLFSEFCTTYCLTLVKHDPLKILGFGLLALIVPALVEAAETAALLGVLKESGKEKTVGQIIMTSVRIYTGTLFWLSILLAFIAVIVWVPVGFFLTHFLIPMKSHTPGFFIESVLTFFAIMYLIFIKFALARPLVVIAQESAGEAIYDSWVMTKGYFGFVLGCYVFMGATHYFVGDLLKHATMGAATGSKISDFLLQGFFGCLWNLMAWCMYWRIKAQSEEQPEIATETLAN